jgi:hypothetical protein
MTDSTLVKFSCGCIGVRSGVDPHTGSWDANSCGDYVIVRCEGSDRHEDDGGLHFAYRDLSNKDVTPLSGQEALDLLNKLAPLVFDGFAWRRFTQDLRFSMERGSNQ